MKEYKFFLTQVYRRTGLNPWFTSIRAEMRSNPIDLLGRTCEMLGWLKQKKVLLFLLIYRILPVLIDEIPIDPNEHIEVPDNILRQIQFDWSLQHHVSKKKGRHQRKVQIQQTDRK